VHCEPKWFLYSQFSTEVKRDQVNGANTALTEILEWGRGILLILILRDSKE